MGEAAKQLVEGISRGVRNSSPRLQNRSVDHKRSSLLEHMRSERVHTEAIVQVGVETPWIGDEIASAENVQAAA